MGMNSYIYSLCINVEHVLHVRIHETGRVLVHVLCIEHYVRLCVYVLACVRVRGGRVWVLGVRRPKRAVVDRCLD